MIIPDSRLASPFVVSLIAELEACGLSPTYNHELYTEYRERYLVSGEIYTGAEMPSDVSRFRLMSEGSGTYLDWCDRCFGIERATASDDNELYMTGDEERDKELFCKFLARGASDLVRTGSDEGYKQGLNWATLYGQVRGYVKSGGGITIDQSQKLVMNQAQGALDKARDTLQRIGNHDKTN